jgi:integrase
VGDVLNRGTKDRPLWYCRYVDIDGKRRHKPTHQPTRALAQRYLAEVEARIARGLIGIPEQQADSAPVVGQLMEEWAAGLTNRSACNDQSRIRRHLLPVFGKLTISSLDLRAVMKWIDDLRAGRVPRLSQVRGRQPRQGRLSDPTIRHVLNLLSRFFSWAVERGHAATNPVRQMPTGKRPQQSPKSDVPWLEDDAQVRQLIADLAEPVNLMFYLGNRAGLRTGEICGLRLSDLAFLAEGIIRVRFSYSGPLKEDKTGSGKAKWAPAPDDAAALLGPWVARRRAEGAGPEDLVFPRPGGEPGCCRATYVARRWDKAAAGRGLSLTWYQATRHSFVSRNLSRGASLDEVSAAVGHSSPVVTRRYYDHFVRRSFSAGLREGLGLGGKGEAGEIIPLQAPARKQSPRLDGPYLDQIANIDPQPAK